MSSRTHITGIVLAGGKSTRLGRDKAIEPLGDEFLIQRVLRRLSQVTDETIVVVADSSRGRELPLSESTRVAVDLYPHCGSLGGIFTGLTAASGNWGIVVACDMPFLNVNLLNHLLSIREGYEVVVPVLNGRPEPTHAVYSIRCLPQIEYHLKSNDLKISKFFDKVRVNYIPSEKITIEDPEHLSFFNVNTQEELDLALSLVDRGH